jgi:hypothetical protein
MAVADLQRNGRDVLRSGTRVFVSCSDGHVTIAHMDSPDRLSVLQTLEMSPRSRTMALDHHSPIHQLFSGR